MADFVITPRHQSVWDGLDPDGKALLERAAGRSLPAGGDREDTLEELARLEAAVAAVPAGHLWVEQERTNWGTCPAAAMNWETGEVAPAEMSAMMFSIGSVPNLHDNATYQQDPRFETARFIDRYFDSPVFLRHAGRVVARTSSSDYAKDDGYLAVEDAINEMPGPYAFIKATQSKLGAFQTPAPWNSSDFYGQVSLSALSQPGGLLVQPAIQMRYEYRVFVVGHQIVTAAGNVEHHTPLDNTELFDPAMEVIRNSGLVEGFPAVRDQHLEFARTFVQEWQAEHPQHGLYVLDVALGPTDTPLVVELNSLNNAGLYACDTSALFTTWVNHLTQNETASL